MFDVKRSFKTEITAWKALFYHQNILIFVFKEFCYFNQKKAKPEI